jgi:hypothetical protein
LAGFRVSGQSEISDFLSGGFDDPFDDPIAFGPLVAFPLG